MERYELPKDWRWVRLGEVCEIVGGGTPRRNDPKFWGGDIVWLTPRELPTDSITEVYESDIKITEEGLRSSSARPLPPGTVVYSSRATIGKIAIAGVPLATNQGFANFTCQSDIFNKYLAHCLRWLTSKIQNLAGQTTFPEVKKSDLKLFQIPLPPLPEQRRIVARIEELVSRIEEAKRLRRAAREETDAIMPAALYEVFSRANTQGWKQSKVAELITDIKTGTTPPSKETKYYGGNIQWFTPGDLGRSKYLIKSNRTLTATAIKGKKAKTFKEGTILFVGIGATLGKVGIAAAEVSSNQQITGLYFGPAIIPDFAYYWFRFKYDYIRLLSSAVTLPIINQDGLKDLVMEFPPLEEQRRIVTYLDRLQVKVEKLRRLQEEIQKEIDAMTSAILDKAFRGEL